ncbi:MAG: hypothetical protein GY847_41885 [Proteobacteria bacterium]|nr:hypothetical protein [Pseudomonadota bacterium]
MTFSADGEELSFENSSLEIVPSDGIEIGELEQNGNSNVAAVLNVDSIAALGPKAVIFTSPGIEATGTIYIIEGEQTEATLAFDPPTVKQGETKTINVTGTDTSFVAGQSTLTITKGDGVETGALDVVNETQAIFEISVDADAPVGGREVMITTNGEVAEGVLVIDNADSEDIPSITIDPDEIRAGTAVDFSVVGENTHFSSQSVVLFEDFSGVAVSDLVVSSETQLTFIGTAQADAMLGDKTLTVTSPVGEDDEVVTATVTVLQGASLIADPDNGLQGSEGFEVRLIGTNTSFDKSTVVESQSGSGVHVISSDFVSGIVVDTVLDIDEGATVGLTALTATTDGVEIEAEFEVIDYDFDGGTDTDTDSDVDLDGGPDAGGSCNDFDVDPSVISAGRYDVSVWLRGDGTNWTSGSQVELSPAQDHLFLESSSVSTPQDIHLSITAGLFAIPGDVDVLVTEDGETLCGTLTILEEVVNEATVPTEYLPVYSHYTGTVDSRVGDFHEYYQITPQAGDMLVFHAIPDDLITLDVILRLVDSTGDVSMIYVNDETPLGVDARFAYYFAQEATVYVGVGAWGDDEYGSFDFYIYRLTHGVMVHEGVAENGELNDPELVLNDMPYVVHGNLSDENDVDVFQVTTTEPAAIDVVARRLGAWTGSTVDTKITVYDLAQTEITSGSAWYEVPSTSDPRVFLDAAGTYLVAVESEEQTSGFYGINVRPRLVINEVDNRNITIDPFVELTGPADFNLSNCEICTYDQYGDPVDAENPCLSLVGKSTNSSGYYVAYNSILPEDTINLPLAEPGAVVLLDNGVIVDKVQYGTFGADTFAEGTPAEVGERRTIGRGAEVDTGDNHADFIYMGDATLGGPNDRTYQSPIPPYLEPEG